MSPIEPGPESVEALQRIARSVSAAPSGPDIILYTGGAGDSARAAAEVSGISILDRTARAALLENGEFQVALAKAAGVKEPDVGEVRNKLRKGRDGGRELADSDPDKKAAVAANQLLHGVRGDVDSLQNSFWGEASREFAEGARRDVIVMVGEPIEGVLWAVELPALQALSASGNAPQLNLNNIPAASLPKGRDAAFAALTPSGVALAIVVAALPAGADVSAAIKKALASFSPSRSGASTATRLAARILDPVIHPLPGVLQPGPGSFNVIIGGKPAWRGVPAGAAAAIQSAKATSDATIQAAEAATLAAAGTPGAPAAKAAEEATKAAAAASMGSMISGAAGGADIHACLTPLPIPPHGPGVVIDGSQTVLINGLCACRVGDTIIEAVGPPNKIAFGEPTVMIGG
ncbi:PAAR domain-containing protein [Bosea sp. (in: a-proteobacteria)]|uniref:PAAR domain-containing protein n=1 Tax=Bosea sp. (in: a-proteobacteria) TaxID=1871050 RepID=UPI002FCC8C87